MSRKTILKSASLTLAVVLSLSSAALSEKPAEKDPAAPAVPEGVDMAFIHLGVALDDGQARRQAVSHIRSREAHAKAIANMEQCKTCHDPNPVPSSLFHMVDLDGAMKVEEGPWIGVSVGPADDVLRAQLNLPEGTGLVVTEVMEDGPAKQAGVEPHDILLSVNGQPLPAGEALTEAVKAHKPEGPPLALSLLRAGRRLEKQVTPTGRPQPLVQYLSISFFGDYRIGVDVTEPDETLRRQLGLEGKGLVVTAVTADSPAQKQGLKVNDVLISADGTPLRQQQDLSEAVRRAGAAQSQVELELMRGGVTLKIGVAPEKQTQSPAWLGTQDYVLSANDAVDATPSRELMLVRPGTISKEGAGPGAAGAPAAVAERLDQIKAQLDQLHAAVESLRSETSVEPKKE